MQLPKNTINFILLLLLLLLLSSKSLQHEDQQQIPYPAPAAYWHQIKALVQSYFFPTPNLDFRGSITNDEPPTTAAAADGGDKLKEAVTKSLGKGKATVEESARSAAQLAKDTMQNTAQKLKLKNTLSSQEDEDL